MCICVCRSKNGLNRHMLREHNVSENSRTERVKTQRKTKQSNQNGKYLEPDKNASGGEDNRRESKIKGEPPEPGAIITLYFIILEM